MRWTPALRQLTEGLQALSMEAAPQSVTASEIGIRCGLRPSVVGLLLADPERRVAVNCAIGFDWIDGVEVMPA